MLKMYRFLQFLLKGARTMMALMIVTGLVAGLSSVGLLAVINKLINGAGSTSQVFAVAFIGLALLKVVTNYLSQLLLVKFAQQTIFNLGMELCWKVVRAPYRTLERRGAHEILATLTDDTNAMAWAVNGLPGLAINVAILAGCSLYLAWLSWQAFLAVVVLAIVGLLGYRQLYHRVLQSSLAVRDAKGALFEHFRSLTEGMKELMLHRARRDAFVAEDIRQAAEALRHHNLVTTKQYLASDSWTQVLFYGLIGVILLLFPRLLALSGESLTGYAFAMLYMIGPMWGLIGMVPAISRGQVALEKIEQLGLALGEGNPEAGAERPITPGVQQVEFSHAIFSYDSQSDGERSFTLGPVDLHLATGELVFIIGGNGSGKSTFVKVLTGLYLPQQGAVRLNGETMTPSTQDWYRQHFAAVFSDFYLFKKLLGLDPSLIASQAESWLKRLRIEHKTTIQNGEYSTVNLSQGQRKRLALVTAMLEDRPFYVFDEWAADQDPQYKEIFYGELLPDLRSRGKGVIVVTHDDRYFHVGDRVLKLDEGKLVDASASVTRGAPRMSPILKPIARPSA
ncbi:MAG TPA: cyclic peptide export ABC transporter [Nitrospira sp.]|jgi:putative ATP-binding cassette transporter|nr:cyclic peptide export ABC transporter [Nitrospira sp.]